MSMGFPRAVGSKDKAELESMNCSQWKETAQADDSKSYDEYYSTPDKQSIAMIKALGQNHYSYPCVQGASEWESVGSKITNLKSYFSPDAEVNFLSCVVGLGSVGEDFTLRIAKLFLPAGGTGRVQAALKFGLGDWSMDKGMGFWDYINDDQLAKDSKDYETNKRDANMAQSGDVRVASHPQSGYEVTLLQNQSCSFSRACFSRCLRQVLVDWMEFGPHSDLATRTARDPSRSSEIHPYSWDKGSSDPEVIPRPKARSTQARSARPAPDPKAAGAPQRCQIQPKTRLEGRAPMPVIRW